MSLNRYLLNIAYIGTYFRGAQRQVSGVLPRVDDPSTIQGRLETALKQLNPCNEPVVYLSSRTDSGVHALNTTCHVDLLRKNGLVYDPKSVTICLNKYFHKHELPIKVLQTNLVPDDFHCRHNAISRTYLYRLIVNTCSKDRFSSFYKHCPIEEVQRAAFYCTDSFDLEGMREAAKLFEGRHDFRTFMKVHEGHLEKDTKKDMHKFYIEEVPRVGYTDYSWPSWVLPDLDNFRFLNVYIKSKSFLFRQVRRTVGTLVAFSQGKVTLRDIKFMLGVPSHRSWPPQIKSVPAHGLYLCEVEYAKSDSERFRRSVDI